MDSTHPKNRLKNDRVRRMLLMVDDYTTPCPDNDKDDKEMKQYTEQSETTLQFTISTKGNDELRGDKRDNNEGCFDCPEIIQLASHTNTQDINNKGGDRNDKEVEQCFEHCKISPAPTASTSTGNIRSKLRNIPPKKYVDDNQEYDGDFSSDCSEYVPSPDIDRNNSPQSSLSSLGGDSQRIYKILTSEELTKTPSTISNVSLILSNIDFVASPSVIYKATSASGQSSALQKIDNQSGCKTPINTQEKDYDNETDFNETDFNETLKPNDITHNEKTPTLECSTNLIVPIHDNTIEGIHLPTDEDTSREITSLNLEIFSSTEKNVKSSRKRKQNIKEWRCNKNKILKNSGQAYEGCNSKKKYPNKTIGPVCVCKKKCGEKFNPSKRQQIFDRYYNMADCEQQWLFISRYVETKPIKRMTLVRKNNRMQTINYFLPLENERVDVCKTFFLNTLKIGEQVVYTALEKVLKSDEGLKDKRGCHENRPKKMKNSTEATIKKHIELFPKVESHYTRKNTKKEYLSEDLNISKMYRLYIEWFAEQDHTVDVPMATKRQYEVVFNSQYNYSFFKPKKDQCLTCSIYKQAEPEEKATLEEKQSIHMQKKEKVRLLKTAEINNGDKNNTVIAIFDLQKVLSVPQSEVGLFHYKRKYPCYNFTVFDALRKIGYCYVWHYQIAKRGSSEIGSALLKYIQDQHAQGITTFSFYSDGCYGQNKNRYIFALYLYISRLLGVSISHRFFETGHSQNEGDSMHACIEKNLKHKVLYTPEQIYNIILNSKVTGEKYRVHELEQTEVFDLKPLVDPKLWRLDIGGNIIRWADVMEVRVTNQEENKLLYRYNFDEEYSKLDLNKPFSSVSKRRGRKRNINNNDPCTSTERDVELKCAYDRPIPISKPLYTDLVSLCTTGAIPRHYHAFYKSLSFQEVNTLSDTDEN